MRIAFHTPAVPGHLHPSVALAKRLMARGHDVTFIAQPENVPIFEGMGVRAFGYQSSVFRPGEYGQRVQELSRLQGMEAVTYTFQLLSDGTRAILQGGEQAVEELRADGMVLDSISTGMNLIARKMGVPYVQMSNALYLDLTGSAPLAMFDWPHERSDVARERNRKGVEGFRLRYAPVLAAAREYDEQWGLGIDWDDPFAGASPLGHVSQTPREFDFVSEVYPAGFVHCGPFIDVTARNPVEFPWDRLTGEPLIYVSLGTLQNGRGNLFKLIAQAANGPARQVVLSIGSNISVDEVGPVPSNCIVVQRAPQLELLQRAALCITHAGLNTVLESLSFGVPLVAIPITNDQPGVAARVKASGTGMFASLPQLDLRWMQDAIRRVMSEPHFRDNARRFQQIIASRDGLGMAADAIEEKLGAGGGRAGASFVPGD